MNPRAAARAALVVFAVAALHGPAAEALASGKKLLAVLPLDTQHTKGTVDADARTSLEEMIRDVATNELEPSGWVILTGETMLQILSDNGIDPTRCTEESCHLGTAREIDAGVFISGSVQLVDDRYTASIRLIETATGKILSTASLEGKNVMALRDAFLAQAPAFFARSGLVTPQPVQTTASPALSSARLVVHVLPEALARLVIRDPYGNDVGSISPYENDFAKPGHWTVTASAPGYARESRDLDLAEGESQDVELELKQHGRLTVSGRPADARVDVAGPRDFHSGGALPWTGRHLRSGSYHVIVAHDGYYPSTQDVTVSPGATTHVDVNLQRRIDLTAVPEPQVPLVPSVSVAGRRRAAFSIFGVAGVSAVASATGWLLAVASKSAINAQSFPVDQGERQRLLTRAQVGNVMGISGLASAVTMGLVGWLVYPGGSR